MADHLGFYNTSSSRTHVGFCFTSHAGTGAAVAPSSAFEAADLLIYRAADGAAFSATQRSSANGITMTSPFDSVVGLHNVDIDLTDNTDAGFWASGYRYMVVLSPDETVDSVSVVRVLAYFEITNPVITSITALNNLSAAQVNAEVLDVLNVDTFAEPGQEAPPATTTIVKKLGWLYKMARNKLVQTSTQISIYNDDAATVDAKSTVSTAGTTYTKGEFVSGP